MTYKFNSEVNSTRVQLNILVPRLFCDREDLEYTQDLYEFSPPDVCTPDSGIVFIGYEGNESVAGGRDTSNP